MKRRTESVASGANFSTHSGFVDASDSKQILVPSPTRGLPRNGHTVFLTHFPCCRTPLDDQFSLNVHSIHIFISVLACCMCGKVALFSGASGDKLSVNGLLFKHIFFLHRARYPRTSSAAVRSPLVSSKRWGREKATYPLVDSIPRSLGDD